MYPVFLGFFAHRLVFASTALMNRAPSRETLLQQLAASMVDARRNRFLADDFKFANTRTMTLADLM